MSEPDQVKFFVAMIPRKKNNLKPFRRGNFVRLHYDEKTKAAQDTLAARVYEHRPATPWGDPVRLDVVFVFAVPEGWPNWKRSAALAGRLLHVTRPDRGNLLKLLEDALKGPFYADDSEVVAGEVGKRYGEVAGYEITLTRLRQATRESETQLRVGAELAERSKRSIVDAGPYDGSCLESVGETACGKPSANAFRHMGGVVPVCVDHAREHASRGGALMDPGP